MPFALTAFSAPAAGTTRRDAAIAYAVCPILLLASGYGLWKWIGLTANPGLGQHDVNFLLIGLVLLPLALFLFLSIVSAQRFEHARLSHSYQLRLDHLQKRLNHQEDLLHSLMDHSEAMAIFDSENRYWFLNKRAAQGLGHAATEIIGKLPSRIMGYERTRRLEARLDEVRSGGYPIEALEQITDAGGRVRFVQVHYEKIARVGDMTDGVMVREEDITSLIVERTRREHMLRQVISALVAVVDRRDPYAAGHSARVGQLARMIAEEMMLDEKQIEAAEIAGSLMNFGKVLVPREILTKTTPLTVDELQRVRDSILTSADILSIIDFSLPVVPTLRQTMERVDGTGLPNGLRGDDILVTARIVTVANAYVALVSPRAHRSSMELKDALTNMMRDIDKTFDRSVVTALANCIEKNAAKLDWLTRTKQA
jgi:PAS domain S-box-containing protein